MDLVFKNCIFNVFFFNHEGQVQPSNPAEPVSQTCLGCICEASSGCNTTLKCNGDVCGPFRITWAYWADSGKPTLSDEPAGSKDGNFSLFFFP